MTAYAELAAASNFSFLRGASHPGELVLTALQLGHTGIGLADRNTVAGVVRAYAALKELREGKNAAPAAAFKLAVGTRLVFADDTPDIVAYPATRDGWGRLCRLLTLGNRRAPKGECHLTRADLLADTAGLLLVVMPEGCTPAVLNEVAIAAPGAVWLAATMPRHGDDRRRLAGLRDLAAAARVPLLAMNDVLYDRPAQRDLQDVLTCIREGIPLARAGRRLEANAERHLKPATEMARLFRDAPDAVAETQHLLARIDFSLDQLRYEYPDEPVPAGWTPQAWLEELTARHAASRYPNGVPTKVASQLRDELALIAQLAYAPYFLTIHDIVYFARGRGILCQGRGSAANSAVCFVLGITAVDPAEHNLLFARFISAERQEPPDIDVDFEHERREEVMQYVYAKYGRHRAGIVATVISYRPRSALRDVGKALGLPEDITARLASTQWGSWGSDIPEEHVTQAGLDPTNQLIARTLGLAARLLGFPRHLSQHVGGFVMARGRLDEIVPVGNAAMPGRTFIEWDKDDIDVLGLMKVDVLALGMLTCIRKAFALLRDHAGIAMSLADVPRDDPAVYDMLCRGDSLGVFQVESRAQMNMLPRLKPRIFYDLVIQVAIVRPGPIEGDMVHPYLRRRSGVEQPILPSPAPPHDPNELQDVLGHTFGVPLFQEQAMKLAMVAAEFSDVEANKLRRAMATFRNLGTIGTFEALMVERMVARGYERDFALRCFEQIKGFGSYGFPESHAASFAKLVYVSSWIKCHHPAVFACALLNAQPMGFYAPAQIVRDAAEHGVTIYPADINHSAWDNALEPGPVPGLRLGLRQIEGLHAVDGQRIAALRGAGYPDIEALAMRTDLRAPTLRLLADADACRSLRLDRRAAMWAVRRLPDAAPLPLFTAARAQELAAEADARLPSMPLAEHIAADYQTMRLSLKGHPMGMLRPLFRAEGLRSAAEIAASRDGACVCTAGLVLVRQRPGKGNAIFITLEDETGITNIVLWASLLETFRRAVMAARLMSVEGRVQKSPEGVVHLMATSVQDRSAELNHLFDTPHPNLPLAPADEFQHPQIPRGHHPRDARILPKSRDFH
jgi:error-prone DNA polymerase